MALPKLNTIKFELEVPSTGEKIEYRPFLVKEQKVLMIAQESEDTTVIQKAIADTIESCTFGKVDPWSVPSFDLEYIFINIRGKSIGEELQLQVTCPDDGETVVPITIDLEKIKVVEHDDHIPIISLTDDIDMYMEYPTMKDISAIQAGDSNDTEQLFDMIKTCIKSIHDGEEIYNKVDITDKDLTEFIDSMSTQNLNSINDFFTTMPKLEHRVKVKNPNTEVESEVTLSGFDDFFV
jgi:anti-anti-sigma regulatory factor